ncbi:MAG: hypothetical protein JO210_17150 [Acidobacteriaceae bacterium]|nr:hypothetical protein [Acidobacteriaceae bacterium]
MSKFILVPLTLLFALGARATTLSDNLTSPTFATELINGTTWITAGFRTASSSYLLNSATFLMQQDSPGTLNVALYSSTAMQPANNLGYQPGSQLGSLTATATFPSLLGQVTFGGNNLLLTPDTTYWLVMSAPISGSYEWAYESGNSGSGIGFNPSWGISNDSGASWFTDNLQPMQMSVKGTPVSATPEPDAVRLVLLGVGMVMGTANKLQSRRKFANRSDRCE